jgi:hypothetical protein
MSTVLWRAADTGGGGASPRHPDTDLLSSEHDCVASSPLLATHSDDRGGPAVRADADASPTTSAMSAPSSSVAVGCVVLAGMIASWIAMSLLLQVRGWWC